MTTPRKPPSTVARPAKPAGPGRRADPALLEETAKAAAAAAAAARAAEAAVAASKPPAGTGRAAATGRGAQPKPVDQAAVAAAAVEILRRRVAAGSGEGAFEKAVREFREAVDKAADDRERGVAGAPATATEAVLKKLGETQSPTDFGRGRAGALAGEVGRVRGAEQGDVSGGAMRRNLLRALTDAGKSAFTASGAMMAVKFAAVLGPLAIMGQLLQSNAAGFQVLGLAIKLLVTTLAPLLLPVVVALAAAMVEFSDKLWAEILPELEDWYTFVVGTLLPALRTFADVLLGVASVVKDVFSVLVDVADGISTAVSSIFKGKVSDVKGITDALTDWAVEFAGAGPGGDAPDAAAPGVFDAAVGWSGARPAPGGIFGGIGGAAAAAAPGGIFSGIGGAAAVAGGAPGGPGGRGDGGALGDVLKSIRLSLGPRAQFASFSQVSKNAQLAALNSDPLEQRMLERMTKSLEVLERVEVNTRPHGGLRD